MINPLSNYPKPPPPKTSVDMIPKNVSGTYAKCLILLCITMGGCGPLISKPTPPATQVCPAAAMAECDTKDPATPATAAETSADFAMDLATFFKAQRNECAALNNAKIDCIKPKSKKSK